MGDDRDRTEDQAREGVSLDNKKSKIMIYCELKYMDLIEIIEDASIGAKSSPLQ